MNLSDSEAYLQFYDLLTSLKIIANYKKIRKIAFIILKTENFCFQKLLG